MMFPNRRRALTEGIITIILVLLTANAGALLINEMDFSANVAFLTAFAWGILCGFIGIQGFMLRNM